MRKETGTLVRRLTLCGVAVVGLSVATISSARDRDDLITTASTAGTTAYIVGKNIDDDFTQAQDFADTQSVALRREAATGEGENLDALAALPPKQFRSLVWDRLPEGTQRDGLAFDMLRATPARYDELQKALGFAVIDNARLIDRIVTGGEVGLPLSAQSRTDASNAGAGLGTIIGRFSTDEKIDLYDRLVDRIVTTGIDDALAVELFQQLIHLPLSSAQRARVEASIRKQAVGGRGAEDNTAAWFVPSLLIFAAVFGMGGIGLSVIQGAVMAKAERIIAIDVNNDKEKIARQFGATDFINPKDYSNSIQEVIVELTDGGVDYSFECIGNVKVMRQALECAHKGWGESIVIGVAGAGQEISTRPFQLVTGRSWRGSAFGGARGRTDVPKIVDWYMQGLIEIDPMITHTMPLDRINEGFDLMHKGESIRGVVVY